MHAPPESIEIFVLCNAIFSLREKFLSKMFDPAIVIFMPIYVYVSFSSTSAAGSGSPYFVFFFWISVVGILCSWVSIIRIHTKYQNRCQNRDFFLWLIAFWSGWDFKKNRANPAEIGKILQSSYQTAALPNIFGKCHALQLA